DAAAAIVAAYREASKPELVHDGDHVARHCSFCVGRMVSGRGWAAAAAIAAQIGADHLEAASQQGGDLAPHQVGLWKAVQQQERRARAARTNKDRRLTGLTLRGGEIVHRF